MKKWLNKWNRYKYRFVPWITFNLKNRTVREVPNVSQDNIIPDKTLQHYLAGFITALHDNEARHDTVNNSKHTSQTSALDVMKEVFGYQIQRKPSLLTGGGEGLFVTHGIVPMGSLVALYPGTTYWPYEPIFFQSIHNQFVFRCVDGLLIDGNDRGISKFIFRSSGLRDQLGPHMPCDLSWLDNTFLNPLAVGQYANNGSKTHPANVAYQELDLLIQTMPIYLLRYIPNVWYGADNIGRDNPFIRTVALVSTREIHEGEEILSSYFTVIH